jgi:hypothetical protein
VFGVLFVYVAVRPLIGERPLTMRMPGRRRLVETA